MVERRWLVNDARELYLQESEFVNKDSLDKSFAANFERLELFAVIGDFGKEQIKVADRPKYIGSFFFDGRVEFPELDKEMSDLTEAKIQFSELTLKINNLDGKYSKYLPYGADYRPFINEKVSLYVGRSDKEEGFRELFKGVVHQEGGVSYDMKYITFSVRDTFERLNNKVPLPTINTSVFPNAPEDSIGQIIPFALGDFEEGFNYSDGGFTKTKVLYAGAVQDLNAYVKVADEDFAGGILGFNVGGSRFVFCIGGNYEGKTYYPTTINHCLLWRGQYLFELYFSTSPLATGGYWGVEIYGLVREGTFEVLNYVYEKGDRLLISTKIPGSGNTFFDANTDRNIVSQIEEVLVTMGRIDRNADIDQANFSDLKNHSSISAIFSRVWIGDINTNVLNYSISMCKQVLLDMYSSRENKIKLSLFNPDYFPQISSMRLIKSSEIVEDSFKPQQLTKDFFTSAKATYSYSVFANGNALQTSFYYNAVSESIVQKRVDKQIDFPNLYNSSHVTNKLKIYVQLFSSALEMIKMTVSWKGLDYELGEFVRIIYHVGGIALFNVPAQIRKISINPDGFSVDLELLSFVNFEFPTYNADNSDKHLSSYNATLNER